MKTLLIVLLVLVLAVVTFLTRPSKADFEEYAMAHPEIVTAPPSNKQALLEKLGEKLKTFASPTETKETRVKAYLDSLTYDNYFLWTNVKGPDGQTIYTGVWGMWFKRSGAEATKTPVSA